MLYSIFVTLLLFSPLSLMADNTPPSAQHLHKTVQATELKSWYDQQIAMTIVDARSKEYFDGKLLPHAFWLPSESSNKEIQTALPDRDRLIVVYCAGVKCPASGWLYDKLISLGYSNVFEYHEGIQDWIQQGCPIENQIL